MVLEVAHWKHNDNAATTNVVDAVGSYDATAQRNTSLLTSAGKINTSLDYNGSTDYVTTTGALAGISSATAGAIACWVNIDTDDGAQNRVWSIARNADGTRTEVILDFDMRAGQDRIQVFLRTDGTMQWHFRGVIDELDPLVGSFAHIAVVHDGTIAAFYINNVDITSSGTWVTSTDRTKWFKALLTDAASPSDIMTLGTFKYNGGTTTAFFDGKLDDVRLYDFEITSDDVGLIYNSGNGTEEGLEKLRGITGTLAATLPALTASMTGLRTIPVGTLAATLPSLTASLIARRGIAAIKERPMIHTAKQWNSVYNNVKTYNHNIGIINDWRANLTNSISSGWVKTDGSVPMIADWDAGAYKITTGSMLLDEAGGLTLSAANAVITHSGATSLTVSSTSGYVDIESVRFTGTAITQATDVTIASANGVDYTPGSDTDVDIATVNVTGTPKIWWDESEDAFNYNKPINIIHSDANTHTCLKIVPDTALAASQTWHGVEIDGAALDPSGASAVVHAVSIDLSGVNLTNDPDVHGIDIELPATDSGQTDKCGIDIDAFGMSAHILDNDGHAFRVTGNGIIESIFDLSGMSTGLIAQGIILQGDANQASGGMGYAVDVELFGTGLDSAYGMRTVGEELGVFLQETGTPAVLGKAWSVDSAVWTDRTTAFNSAVTNVTIFPDDNDLIYIGAAAEFNVVEVTLNTDASANLLPTFDYYDGATWSTLNVTDGTDGFVNSGLITFSPPGDWATTQVNGEGDGPWYYIRITRTRNNVVTDAIEETISIVDTTDYSWDYQGIATMNYPIITGTQTPASAAATGTTGTFTWDSSYLYICTATNTWRRVAHSTW